MKKTSVLIAIFVLASFFGFAQNGIQKVDTLYYDGDWKGVPHKAFAEYYRIALYPNNPSANKQFRDFYIDGTLRAKGYFISIDADDNSKSILDGVFESYYKNGKIQSKCTFDHGLLNGELTHYFENGLIEFQGTFKLDKHVGLYTEFHEDGSYSQIEYDENGELAHDYYVFANANGQMMKYKLSDNTPYWETPSTSERKEVYKDGVSWLVYSKNGITIAETCASVNDYGRWHKIDIVISNESLVPIEFDPEDCISAFSIDLEQKPTNLAVLSCQDYMKKVNKAQTWTAVAVGLSEGLATANAGYSTSTTTTTSSYGGTASAYGNSSAYGRASAYGSGGYGYGSFSGNSSYSGRGTYSGYGATTSTTRSYDAAAAYQTHVLSQQRLSDFSYSQWQERRAKEVGYLKKNTIMPGEIISGYVNIQRLDGAVFFNTVHINDAAYKFSWSFGKNGSSTYLSEDVDYLAQYANQKLDELDALWESGNTRKFKESQSSFINWYNGGDITNEAVKARLLDVEKKYIQSQSLVIDDLLAKNRLSRADNALYELEDMYRAFPIQTQELDALFGQCLEKLTPQK